MQHIEAYLDNRVDCSILLEDAEAKEVAVAKLERMEADCNSRFAESKEATQTETKIMFKARELELSELVESLRTRIRDLNVSSFDREKAMKCRTEELMHALNASQTEAVRLRTILASVRTTRSATASDKFSNCTVTSTNVDCEALSTSKACLPAFGDQYRPGPVYLSSHSNSVDESSPRDPLLSTHSTDRSLGCAFGDTGCRVEEASCVVTSNLPDLPVNGPQKPQRKHVCTEPPSPILEGEQLGFPLKNSKHVHQIAREAAAQLAQLLSSLHQSTTCALSATFTVSPIGWIPTGNKTPKNVFDDEVLQRSLGICSISTTANCSPSSFFKQWNEIWNACQKNADEPWSIAMNLCAAAFVSCSQSRRSGKRLVTECVNDQGRPKLPFLLLSSSLTWMDELGLIPEVFSRSHQPAVQCESVMQDSMLYRQLVELWLNSFVAQRLLCQLRFGESADSANAETCFSRLLNEIEFVLAARYECFRHATWSYPVSADNRWFWTASFLHINLLCRLWPAEFQHIIGNLSVLLAACASVLVSVKLPVVLRFALQFAARITANWSANCFEMRCLDALLDWHLTGATSPMATPKAPSNDGHPLMSSHSNGSCGRLPRSSVSFMESFVHLLSQFNPNLLNWPNELNHLEAAARVSLDDVFSRLNQLELVCQVWRSVTVDSTRSGGQISVDCVTEKLGHLRSAAESVRTVARAAASWLLSHADQVSSTSTWLMPLARFATAFKSFTSELLRKRTDPVGSEASIDTPRRREHRRNKYEKAHRENSGKREHRRRKHRTRQLDTDGIVDDILAGLTHRPLRADVHTKCRDSHGQKKSH
ncbi:hypothetical protein P879_06533 [Paragonimus westermani]|uniref:Uncharacterized protein n=1 Tax=Paragonimus westermani TaxID=34504 RepID=A0A8T0D695_9TREM|nr:hypothetical protein P879_06533 [Paragonimus westermani]